MNSKKTIFTLMSSIVLVLILLGGCKSDVVSTNTKEVPKEINQTYLFFKEVSNEGEPYVVG